MSSIQELTALNPQSSSKRPIMTPQQKSRLRKRQTQFLQKENTKAFLGMIGVLIIIIVIILIIVYYQKKK